jgi:hybrid cluster-associated redox disulfide protein
METTRLSDEILLDSPISELVGRWPVLARAFIALNLACLGCDFSRFHTPRQAAQIYGLAAREMLSALRQAPAPASDRSISRPTKE